MQEEHCPIRQLSPSLSVETEYHSISPPHQHHFCHRLSGACLLNCDPLTVASLCFSTLHLGGDSGPCFIHLFIYYFLGEEVSASLC